MDKELKLECIIIRAGLTETPKGTIINEGKETDVYNWYLKEVLKDATEKGMFEGVFSHLRSDEDHLSAFPNPSNTPFGYFSNTKWNEQSEAVTGTLNIYPGEFGKKFKGYIDSIFSRRKESSFEDLNTFDNKTDTGLGLSIKGSFVMSEVEPFPKGVKEYILGFKEITSIDVVEMPNAGGKILNWIT